MKKYLILLCLAAAVACSREASWTVASFNVRYENRGDAERGNAWDTRYPYICQLIRYEKPDIFGAQEVLIDMLHDMCDSLPDYDYVYVGRDDGLEKGEGSPVFWRRDRFDLLDKGWFWLSETPEEPSRGWDAALNRICTWAHLKDKVSGKKVWYFSLHMDHVGVIARAESAKLIVRKVEEMCRPDEAVFVCGDFNVDQTNEIYTTFTGSDVLADSYETAADRYAPTGTINGFDPNTLSRSRIDHIFVSPAVRVDNYAVLTETYRGMVTLGGEGTNNANFPQEVSFQANIAKLPSDHFPVFLKVRF